MWAYNDHYMLIEYVTPRYCTTVNIILIFYESMRHAPQLLSTVYIDKCYILIPPHVSKCGPVCAPSYRDYRGYIAAILYSC